MKESDVLKVYVLPGGKMPERRSPGAEGYDAFTRVITDGELDSFFHMGRKSIWDFGNPSFRTFPAFPGTRFCIGLGFVIDLGNSLNPEENWSFSVELRNSSVLAGFRNLTSGIPIDANFRGEPIALIEFLGLPEDKEFQVEKWGSLVQLVFRGPNGKRFPILEEVRSVDDLSKTNRSNHWNGSTGK